MNHSYILEIGGFSTEISRFVVVGSVFIGGTSRRHDFAGCDACYRVAGLLWPRLKLLGSLSKYKLFAGSVTSDYGRYIEPQVVLLRVVNEYMSSHLSSSDG